MLVNFAKEALTDEMGADAAINDWKFVSFGTDVATSTLLTHTALVAEIVGGAYARLTATQQEGTNPDTYKLTGTWTNESGGAETVGEIGLHDADAAGNLIARQCHADTDFASVVVSDDAQLVIDWQITFNDDSE